MNKVKIMLVEDHPVVREGLKSLIEPIDNFEVIGEAANGKEALDKLGMDAYDIVLLDIEMPVLNGYGTLPLIRSRFPNVKVIMLSVHYHPSHIQHCVSLGAKGYLKKNASIEEIEESVINVHKYGFFLKPEIMTQLLQLKTLRNKEVHYKNRTILTEREEQIFKALCEGKTEKEIALDFCVSTHTVHSHRENIYSKTDSKNIAGLIKYGIINNKLPPEFFT